MKKLSFLLALVFLIATLPTTVVKAAETTTTQEVIYLEDGRYITITLEVEEIAGLNRAVNVKSGTKTYTCKGANGDEEWRIELKGTFTYTGTSSACTAANAGLTITDKDWYAVSRSVKKSGNSAIADYVMGQRLLGITIKEVPINITLSCDANGKLS